MAWLNCTIKEHAINDKNVAYRYNEQKQLNKTS